MVVNCSGVPRKSLRGRLLRLPLAVIPKGLVVPILQGPSRGMRWYVGSGTHGCWLGSYEAGKMARFAASLRLGHVVYDIGANVGIYTLAASRLVGPGGRVIAVEPLPRNVAFLSRHVQMNRCRNTTILQLALSNENGTTAFEVSTNPSQGHIFSKGGLQVRVARLDDVAKAENLPPPDVIKMDVEGSEAKVLEGAEDIIGHHRPLIFLATHGSEVKSDCLAWLRSRGYLVEPMEGLACEFADEFIASAS